MADKDRLQEEVNSQLYKARQYSTPEDEQLLDNKTSTNLKNSQLDNDERHNENAQATAAFEPHIPKVNTDNL